MKLLAKYGLYVLGLYILAWPFSFMAAIGMSETFLGISLKSLYLAPGVYLVLLGSSVSAMAPLLPIMWLPPLFGLGFFIFRYVRSKPD